MSDKMQSEQKDFIIEKIKERPLNKKKLVRRMIITASMAVIFGLIACFTFLVLEPIISNWLYPEEPPQLVVYPEDQEEMDPEDMLSDTIQNTTPEQTEPLPIQPEDITLGDEQIQDILSQVVLDRESYEELYVALMDYVREMEKSLVTVSAYESETDWLENDGRSSRQASGVIVANTGTELLILTEYKKVKGADLLMAEFCNGLQVQAAVKQADEKTSLAVVAVNLEGVSEDYTEGLVIATLGSTGGIRLRGEPVIALGNPMGSSSTLAYGVIVGEEKISMVDAEYKKLQTDIYREPQAGGFLFNLKGRMIGVIMEDTGGGNLIEAYGISDLKKLIEKMSNHIAVPYLGIKGHEVSDLINQELQVPLGIYISEVAKNSPAMRVGIQQGDVLVKLNGYTMQSMVRYSTELMLLEPGQTVELVLMRQSQGEYKEVNVSIVLGEAEGER